jgi:hypothetical protein
LSWSNNQNALSLQGQQKNSQQAAQPVQESKKSDLESILMQLATQQQQMMTQQQQMLTSQEQFMAEEKQFCTEKDRPMQSMSNLFKD